MPEFCMTARVRLVTPTSLGCVVLLQASPRRRQAGRISSPSIREGRRGDAFVRRARGKPHVAAEEYRLRPSLPTDEAEYRRLLGRTRRRYLHANNKQDVGAEERDGWGPRIATLPRKYNALFPSHSNGYQGNEPLCPHFNVVVKHGYHGSFLAFHRGRMAREGFANAKDTGAAHNTSTLTQENTILRKRAGFESIEEARLRFPSRLQCPARRATARAREDIRKRGPDTTRSEHV